MRPAARSDASGATQSTIGIATRVRREQPANRIIFDRCRKSTSAVEKMAQLINAVAADQGVCRDYIAETQLRIEERLLELRTIAIASRSGRWLGTRAPLRHELIELGFVLRRPQANEKVLKFPLLLFEAVQGFLTIFVEGAIAARP
jgi:hypothetical protein